MPPLPSPSPATAGHRPVWLAALALAGCTTAAYLTSFGGALVFDDIDGIARNPTLAQPSLDLVWLAVGPQGGTLSGRPVPNLSLILNHAITGAAPAGYHAGNLLIHLLASLTLFGLVRRTLARPPLAGKFGPQSLPLALVIAGLWALHPLQTESVTYLVQRVESLMGLCYLLTLYCFARSIDSPHPRRWLAGSFLACLAGMGCKEVMVSAPLIVLLYDRTFVTGSWHETWQRRRWFHVSLLGTWLLLGALVLATQNRAGTAGLGTAVSSWEYLLTQCRAIVHYLRLALWPQPLVFDYGTAVIRTLPPVLPQALLLVLLFAGTGWALVRRPVLGFLGAWFFLILAPSSSIVPVATQTMTEHRMYLPLAAVIVLVVLALHPRLGRAALPFWLAVVLALGATTARRNLDYHSPLGLWADTARKLPTNGRAHNTAGAYLLETGRLDEARERFLTALRLDPGHAMAHYNLGNLLTKTGRDADAIASFETALRLDPGLTDAEVNLASALGRLGRTAEAITHYEAALRAQPGAADVLDLLTAAHYQLGNEAAGRGDFGGAIARYRQALALTPDYRPARHNLANALLISGQVDAAIVLYRELLQLNPGDRRLQENLARALELRR